jgi:hypothetical protein
MSEYENACPVKAPKLIKANALVETCASCGAWVERYPEFFGDDDRFWQCDKCGNTSIKIRQGRPYSNQSKQWAWIVEEFEKLWDGSPYWDWETVVTEPPMKDIDWKAIRDWYHSQNIYGYVVTPNGLSEFYPDESGES